MKAMSHSWSHKRCHDEIDCMIPKYVKDAIIKFLLSYEKLLFLSLLIRSHSLALQNLWFVFKASMVLKNNPTALITLKDSNYG